LLTGVDTPNCSALCLMPSFAACTLHQDLWETFVSHNPSTASITLCCMHQPRFVLPHARLLNLFL
jgi:hypothetical protein